MALPLLCTRDLGDAGALQHKFGCFATHRLPSLGAELRQPADADNLPVASARAQTRRDSTVQVLNTVMNARAKCVAMRGRVDHALAEPEHPCSRRPTHCAGWTLNLPVTPWARQAFARHPVALRRLLDGVGGTPVSGRSGRCARAAGGRTAAVTGRAAVAMRPRWRAPGRQHAVQGGAARRLLAYDAAHGHTAVVTPWGFGSRKIALSPGPGRCGRGCSGKRQPPMAFGRGMTHFPFVELFAARRQAGDTVGARPAPSTCGRGVLRLFWGIFPRGSPLGSSCQLGCSLSLARWSHQKSGS